MEKGYYRKFTPEEVEQFISEIEAWFKHYPRKKICPTKLLAVHKGHVREEVMACTLLKEV